MREINETEQRMINGGDNNIVIAGPFVAKNFSLVQNEKITSIVTTVSVNVVKIKRHW